MSLDAMLAAHDESALVALANKGLVRRAKRDFDAGRATITSRNDTTAIVEVDGFEVTITDAGPNPAHCPCSSTALCRHLLTAVFALHDGPDSPSKTLSALDEILNLADTDIHKFGGADMPAAIILATTDVQIEQEGTNISVVLPEMPEPVQFIAGRSLKDAAFKGPASRKRLATTAAILALRSKHGKPLELSGVAPAATESATADIALLNEISAALEQLLVATLRGGASVCLDQVFDLAISARAQSAPRLTGELRALVSEAQLALQRHVSFEPERFAVNVARSYALVRALLKTPEDPRLRGVLQRNYSDTGSINAMVLGAASWHSPSGARGMRVYCFDIGGERWIDAGHARAGGADPSFTPSRAYGLSILGASSTQDLVGHHIRLTAPRLSDDLQLAPSTIAEKLNRVLLSELADSPAMFNDFERARKNLHSRMQSGLRGRNASIPILLEPASIRREGFDEFGQTYRLRLVDRTGSDLPLLIPSKFKEVAKWLEEAGRKLRGLLVVTGNDPNDVGLTLSPVAALLANGREVEICNFAFDRVPTTKNLFKTIARNYVGQMQSIKLDQPKLQSTCNGLIRQIVDRVSGVETTDAVLLKGLEAQGLTILHKAASTYFYSPTASAALRVIYLADSTRSNRPSQTASSLP